MLGKVYGHLARSSELNLGQSGARVGASRGRVWPIPPFDQKIGGTPPFDDCLFCSSNAYGLLQVRGHLASFTSLLVMRYGRGSEATEAVFCL